MYLKSQSGLSLPAALFLIVVLIIMLGTMNQLNDANTMATGREWLSLRAFHVAESGAQISAVHALNSEQALGTCADDFIENKTFSASELSSCLLSVSCQTVTISSATYYTFTSEGRCGQGADQARRVIQIRIRQ